MRDSYFGSVRRLAGRPVATLIAGAAVVWLSAAADAADPGEEAAQPQAVVLSAPRLEAWVSIGNLNGTSHEVVLDPPTGEKVSELIWTLDDVAVIGGRFTFRPSDWLSLDLDGWVNATDQATMDDFDWLSETRTDWSDWSHHDDTELDRAWMLHASAALSIWRSGDVRIEAIAGYRRDHFDWAAYGGSFIYSELGFRDDRGLFDPGELGISYRQDFSAPYLGLGGTVTSGDVSLRARVAGSWWVSAEDRDIHHNRDLLFRESFDDGRMLQSTVEMSYRIAPDLTLRAGWQHLDYAEMTGAARIYTASTGVLQEIVPGDAAGLAHSSNIVSVGLSVKLD